MGWRSSGRFFSIDLLEIDHTKYKDHVTLPVPLEKILSLFQHVDRLSMREEMYPGLSRFCIFGENSFFIRPIPRFVVSFGAPILFLILMLFDVIKNSENNDSIKSEVVKSIYKTLAFPFEILSGNLDSARFATFFFLASKWHMVSIIFPKFNHVLLYGLLAPVDFVLNQLVRDLCSFFDYHPLFYRSFLEPFMYCLFVWSLAYAGGVNNCSTWVVEKLEKIGFNVDGLRSGLVTTAQTVIDGLKQKKQAVFLQGISLFSDGNEVSRPDEANNNFASAGQYSSARARRI